MTVFKEKDFIRKMMKMNYIKPEIEVVECEFESHIASMSGLEDTEWVVKLKVVKPMVTATAVSGVTFGRIK